MISDDKQIFCVTCKGTATQGQTNKRIAVGNSNSCKIQLSHPTLIGSILSHRTFMNVENKQSSALLSTSCSSSLFTSIKNNNCEEEEKADQKENPFVCAVWASSQCCKKASCWNRTKKRREKREEVGWL